MKIRNENDLMTDAAALGPSQMGQTLKSVTSYNEPGLPAPPAGWNKKLGYINTDAGPGTCCG
jgi:hypothetical protein